MKNSHGKGHRIFRKWYWLPAAVLFLGIVSTGILFSIYRFGARQQVAYEHIDTIMDVHIKTATFHLWFEEAITDGRKDNMASAFADLDEAMRLSLVLCRGGESEHGTLIPAIGDPVLLRQAENVRGRLVELKELALQRYQDPLLGGINSALDEQFDEVFRKIQVSAWAIELAAEKKQISDQVETRHLIMFTILIWILVVTGATIGLYIFELRRRQAELALEGAYGEMEQRVEIRTAELANTNRQLRGEVAERQKAEAFLRESESESRRLSLHLHTLLDAIPDSITLLSADLRVLWENRGVAAAGRSHEVIGRYCYAYRHNLSQPCTDCPIHKSFGTGKAEYFQKMVDGKIWALRFFPICNEDGRVENVLEIAKDVTEKMALQAEKMRTAHLASIGELAAGVAHEINNPVNGIINYARILANKNDAGSTQQDIAERIMKEGRRIAGIVNSLLAFARDRKEAKKPVSFENILSESLALTESQMRKKGIKLQIAIPPALPLIFANQQQLQQVVINILNNAQYALNQRHPGEDEEKILDISCTEFRTEQAPFVRISFRDRGTGIASDVLEKIMNPFFSTKPVGEGTGLGLSISHGIIGDHGGRLAVESVEGEFTEVLVDLPVHARETYG